MPNNKKISNKQTNKARTNDKQPWTFSKRPATPPSKSAPQPVKKK